MHMPARFPILLTLMLQYLCYAWGTCMDEADRPYSCPQLEAGAVTLLQTSRSNTIGKTNVNLESPRSNTIGKTNVNLESPRSNVVDKTSSFGSLSQRYSALERQVTHAESDDGFAVIIPGLGSEERVEQVARNIAWLLTQDVAFECWIFLYHPITEFPIDQSRLSPCNLVEHPGFWMSHLLALPLNTTKKRWVLHILDGIEPQPDVNLTAMAQIMLANGLGHAAPTFDVTQQPEDVPEPSVHPIMYRNNEYSVGRVTDFVEMHMDVFSREYFACFQDSIDTSNQLGWGVDAVLPSLCGGAIDGSYVHAGKIGLLDSMTMVKKHGGSYNYVAALEAMKTYLSNFQHLREPRKVTLDWLVLPEAAGSRATTAQQEVLSPAALEDAAAAVSRATTARQEVLSPAAREDRQDRKDQEDAQAHGETMEFETHDDSEEQYFKDLEERKRVLAEQDGEQAAASASEEQDKDGEYDQRELEKHELVQLAETEVVNDGTHTE